MARQLRKKSGTGIYHVMVRGINRQDIFEDEEDYLQMVSILRALSDRHDEQGLRLPPLSIFYAYCLMSNHLHLLLREQEEEVSDSEIKSFLVDSQGIVNPLMVQSLEKSRRNEVLRTMLSLGAGIRQLSRLTGVSFGVIQKLAK
jgi:REP element-mobilizing transposase RayT